MKKMWRIRRTLSLAARNLAESGLLPLLFDARGARPSRPCSSLIDPFFTARKIVKQYQNSRTIRKDKMGVASVIVFMRISMPGHPDVAMPSGWPVRFPEDAGRDATDR